MINTSPTPTDNLSSYSPAPTPAPQQPDYNLHPEGALRPPLRPNRKKALLIGINYHCQRGQLHDTVKDVHNMKVYLIENCNFKRDDIIILTDDMYNPMSQPTKQNILRGMFWLVKDSQPGDSFLLHYSGHGEQFNGLEGDPNGIGESIYPVDFRQAGYISDDDIRRVLVASLQPGAYLTLIFDSFHFSNVLAKLRG